MKLILTMVLAFSLAGCLKTRNDVRESEQRNVMQQQVVSLQRNNADSSSRVLELNETIRDLIGRVEVLENRLQQNASASESNSRQNAETNKSLIQRNEVFQDALIKMEKEMLLMRQEMAQLKAERAALEAQVSSAILNANSSNKLESSSKKQSAIEQAQSSFEKKDWKQAILQYQKYRDDNPKGGKFADATYKIGVSFQELGMKDEAKTFYDEVVNKFPKSDEARRAKIRLKGLKK